MNTQILTYILAGIGCIFTLSVLVVVFVNITEALKSGIARSVSDEVKLLKYRYDNAEKDFGKALRQVLSEDDAMKVSIAYQRIKESHEA